MVQILVGDEFLGGNAIDTYGAGFFYHHFYDAANIFHRDIGARICYKK